MANTNTNVNFLIIMMAITIFFAKLIHYSPNVKDFCAQIVRRLRMRTICALYFF